MGNRYVILLSLSLSACVWVLWGAMDTAKREGETLGRSQKATHGAAPTTPFDPNSVVPEADHGKTFDPATAAADVRAQRIPTNPYTDMTPKTPYDLRAEDPMFEASDRIVVDPEAVIQA